MLKEKERRALKPDAQAFDEIRITTVPRYKTSGLSGSEWRISAQVEFWRKGKMVHESVYRNIETACTFLASEYHRAIDNGKAYFAGEGDVCDQEGCAELATVNYRVKAEYCKDRPHEHRHEFIDELVVRKFCRKHSRRGDAAFDDADNNYELLRGQVAEPHAQDIREAGSMEVHVNSLNELPQAIQDVHTGKHDPNK